MVLEEEDQRRQCLPHVRGPTGGRLETLPHILDVFDNISLWLSCVTILMRGEVCNISTLNDKAMKMASLLLRFPRAWPSGQSGKKAN